jgi:hypothetical protein
MGAKIINGARWRELVCDAGEVHMSEKLLRFTQIWSDLLRCRVLVAKFPAK